MLIGVSTSGGILMEWVALAVYSIFLLRSPHETYPTLRNETHFALSEYQFGGALPPLRNLRFFSEEPSVTK